MRRRIASALVLGALALAASAQAQPDARPKNQCFFMNQFQTWRAPDDKTIFIRVNLHDFYRLDLAHSCPRLTQPQVHLITRTRGSNTICSAIDWDLRVGESGPGGFSEPCIVRNMRKMTPEEVAAIPPKFKP